MMSFPTFVLVNVWAVIIGTAAWYPARQLWQHRLRPRCLSCTSPTWASGVLIALVVLLDGIFEALFIQSLRFIVVALVAICFEEDNHATQVQRALQDRLAEIDFLTGWKKALSVVTLKLVITTRRVWVPVLTSELAVVAEGLFCLPRPAVDLYWRLGWNAHLLALLSTAALLVDSDFLLAESSRWFVFSVFAGKSGPHHLLLEIFPWGSYGWYGACAILGWFLSFMGAASAFAGLLVLTQSHLHNKCSWGPSLVRALNFWAACLCLHMVIYVWSEFHPSSHSYAADAWVLKRDNWWWRLAVEITCLGVTNWLADRRQAKWTTSTSAAKHSSAININATPGCHIPLAHSHPAVLVDSTHSSTAAQLANHAGAIAATVTSLATPQQTAANEGHQQASPTQSGDSQATEDEVCELAQRLVASLQQLLQQQRNSAFVPPTAVETLGASLAAIGPLLPQDLGTLPEVVTAAADLAEFASSHDTEEYQDCLSDIQDSTSKTASPATEPPKSEPFASDSPARRALGRQDTDDQRNNAWSAKVKVLQSAASLKKAAKKLQPSEEVKRNFRERRYQKRNQFVQRLQKAATKLTPCFQGQAS